MKTQTNINQCTSCTHKQPTSGGYCNLFSTEPKGCIVYSPVRQVFEAPRMSVQSRVEYRITAIKDKLLKTFSINKIEEPNKDNLK